MDEGMYMWMGFVIPQRNSRGDTPVEGRAGMGHLIERHNLPLIHQVPNHHAPTDVAPTRHHDHPLQHRGISPSKDGALENHTLGWRSTL